jgi:type IV pilus assembly protein PilY1
MLSNRPRIATLTLSLVLTLCISRAVAEDIDLFSVDQGNVSGRPNILIVIDNSSNWSRQSQQWPASTNPIIVNGENFLPDNSGSPTQGQSEARAILKVLNQLSDGAVNMGLMEFSTAGNSNTNQAGYVRQHLVQMSGSLGDTTTSKGQFAAKLKRMFLNIEAPEEKKDQSNAFGTLMWDVYNYLGGLRNSVGGVSTPTTLADPAAYSPQWSQFSSPLNLADDSCRRTVVIFIGNNTSSGPSNDSVTQEPRPIEALAALGGDTAELQFQQFRRVVPDPPERVDNLGMTAACYNSVSACQSTSGQGLNAGSPTTLCEADFSAINCSCGEPTSADGCTGSSRKYTVAGDVVSYEPSGGFAAPPSNSRWSADEWARFLSTIGVPLPGTVTEANPTGVRVPVTTYTLDVFNKQQDPNFSALLRNMARVSRGKYYQARSEAEIEAALLDILSEAQAVNTAFSSASLPVSATNRAQSENQVFIGLFRPDRLKNPLWFGNLKRYQIVRDGGEGLQLGDSAGRPAINNLTGFLAECATSWWSIASSPLDYWRRVNTDNPDARSFCETSADPWSDAPDGPYVEKGGAAQMLRRGTGTADAGGNFVLDRYVKTKNANNNNVVPFDRGNVAASVSDEVLAFTLGQDRLDDDADSNLTEPRSTIHGDVIHSRPQPVNYGGNTGVVVYYGANDGHLRAVRAEDGKELWSFVDRSHFGRLARLHRNEPKIRYFGDPDQAEFETEDGSAVFRLERKDYFFDGSIGLLQNEDSSRVWIFPSMRRGGRSVLAFDVSVPASPTLKWKVGCPSADTGDDTGCTEGFSNIGQTWSLPSPIPVGGADGVDEVVVFGGGYDICEDAHGTAEAPVKLAPCGDAPKGSEVFVLDADTGAKRAENLRTDRSVVADVVFVDVNNDEIVDFGYAVDAGGGVYRVDFRTSPFAITKIAQTDSTSGRKFLNAPALLLSRIGEIPVVYLALGAGDREHPLRSQYPTPTGMLNRFYVFKDLPTQPEDEENPLPLMLDTDPRIVDQNQPDNPDQCFAEAVTPTSASVGWYINLDEHGSPGNSEGEQVVTSAVIAGGRVFFSTNQPGQSGQQLQACTNDLGIARGYSLDIVTGEGAFAGAGGCAERSQEFTGGGLPPPPVTAEVPVCDANGQNCRTESICIGCITTNGELACGEGSPLEACPIYLGIRPIRRPLYWHTNSEAE